MTETRVPITLVERWASLPNLPGEHDSRFDMARDYMDVRKQLAAVLGAAQDYRDAIDAYLISIIVSAPQWVEAAKALNATTALDRLLVDERRRRDAAKEAATS